MQRDPVTAPPSTISFFFRTRSSASRSVVRVVLICNIHARKSVSSPLRFCFGMEETMVSRKSLFAIDSDEESPHVSDKVDVDPKPTDSSCSTSDRPVMSDSNQQTSELDSSLKEDEQIGANDTTTVSEQSAVGTGTSQQLSAFQRAKIERNRQQALLLRQARLQAHPYKKYF